MGTLRKAIGIFMNTNIAPSFVPNDTKCEPQKNTSKKKLSTKISKGKVEVK